jgi:tetratricopeptide (TPR) repeat protein
MSDEKARELEERGIQAAKAGNKDEARKLLQNALRLNPNSENGWLWLASVLKEKKERLLCLQKVLEINPSNEMALKAVRAFGVDPNQLVPQRGSLSQSLADDDEVGGDANIPVPNAEKIAQNQAELAQLLQTYDAQKIPPKKVQWVKKSKNRAGEREIVVLRAQIGAALATFATIVVALAFFAISNSPDIQLVLFGASPTPRLPTSTPTNTPTNTPGFTPTPSPTKDFTVEPTFTPSLTPADPLVLVAWPTGVEERTPLPSAVYLAVQLNSPLSTAVIALQKNEPDVALPLAATEQARLGNLFNPYPAYLQAIAYVQNNDTDSAIAILEEAETRLSDTQSSSAVSRDDARQYAPLINLGFARAFIQQAKNAQARGLTGEVARLVALIKERSEAILVDFPTFIEAYVTLSEAFMLERDYSDAIARLSAAQQVQGLEANVGLVIQKGEVYLAQARRLALEGNASGSRTAFDLAEYQGYLAVYLNPFIERGHGLRIEAAIALGDPGRAVIYSQEYLFYLRNSAEAFRQLGNAREAEGNADLALSVYDIALETGGKRDVVADIYLSRAQLYINEGRFAAALADLNNSLELRDDITVRVQRMRMAYAAGDYETVETDSALLLGSGAISDSEVNLYLARILIDRAEPTDTDTYSTALGLLNRVTTDIPAESLPVADEYRARAHFVLGNLSDALTTINRSLDVLQTGSRRYLRGLIFEAQGNTESALDDYEWLLTWDEVFNYPFMEDVVMRIQTIQTIYAQATATAQTATQTVLDATATISADRTATAEFIATATASAITPTPTVTEQP